MALKVDQNTKKRNFEMNMIKHLSAIILISVQLSFTGCKFSKDASDRRYSRDNAAILKDLRYGPDTLNFLDLYLPANRSEQTPVIITIHGGGWAIGDKSHFKSQYAVDFFDQGIIVANINYRLLGKDVTYKSMLEDIGMAVKFLKTNSEKYGIDQPQISLVGYSAGAHIAMLYAYNDDPENNIRSVLSHWGPTNINDPYFKKIVDSAWVSPDRLPALLGENFVLNSKAAKDCSPVYHIKNVPTLLIHGTKDETVPVEQSIALNDSLKAKGIPHFLLLLPGHKHEGPHDEYKDTVKKVVNSWIYGKYQNQ
ncbi:MAG: carboxylesterase family protein [Bacteroidia bacterium]